MRQDIAILQRVFNASRREDLPGEVLDFCRDYLELRRLAGLPDREIPEEVLLPYLLYYLKSQQVAAEQPAAEGDDDWFSSPGSQPAQPAKRSEPTFLAEKRANPGQWLSEDGAAKRYPGVGELGTFDPGDRSLVDASGKPLGQ